MTIDRPKLWRARWANVLRLARALGLALPPDGCLRCKITLIERVVRRCQ